MSLKYKTSTRETEKNPKTQIMLSFVLLFILFYEIVENSNYVDFGGLVVAVFSS